MNWFTVLESQNSLSTNVHLNRWYEWSHMYISFELWHLSKNNKNACDKCCVTPRLRVDWHRVLVFALFPLLQSRQYLICMYIACPNDNLVVFWLWETPKHDSNEVGQISIFTTTTVCSPLPMPIPLYSGLPHSGTIHKACDDQGQKEPPSSVLCMGSVLPNSYFPSSFYSRRYSEQPYLQILVKPGHMNQSYTSTHQL